MRVTKKSSVRESRISRLVELVCNSSFIIQCLVDLLPFGTKMFNFFGVNAFWNKKLTNFDKNHTVKYTRNTYY